MIAAYLCLLLGAAVFALTPTGSPWALLALLPCALGYWCATGGAERLLRRRGWHT